MKHGILACLVLLCLYGCVASERPTNMNGEEARAVMDDVSRRNLAYEPLTEHDDTMMQQVVAYYKEHGTANDRMEAYYLLGSVYRDLHEAPKAMEAFLNGISAADTTREDCRYDILARLYAQRYEILYRQSLYNQAAEVNRMAYKYAVLAGDSLFVADALWKRMGICFANSDYQTIADECWSLLEESRRLGMYKHAASNLCTSVLANMELGRVEDAARLLAIYEQHSGQVDLATHECPFPMYYYAKGRVMAATGKSDSAEYFYRKELTADDWDNRQAAYRGLRLLFEQKGLQDSVCKYAPLQCDAVDSAYQEMLSAGLQNLHELYDYSRLQTENSRKELQLQQSRRRMLYFWGALAFVVTCALFTLLYIRAWYRQRISDAELRLDRACADLEERENNLSALREELAKVKDEEERQRLAREVEQTERETAGQRQAVMNSQEELDALRRHVRTSAKTLRQRYSETAVFQSLLHKARQGETATEEDFDLVMKVLAEREEGLEARMNTLRARLSKTEFSFFLLLRLGLTKTEAAVLTAHSIASVTNTCTRLFRKFQGRNCATSAEADAWLLKL